MSYDKVNDEKIAAATTVEPGRVIHLHRDFDPGRHDSELGKEAGEEALAAAKTELFDLQDKFYAQADRSLLVVLQAIDAAGKDGTVKHPGPPGTALATHLSAPRQEHLAPAVPSDQRPGKASVENGTVVVKLFLHLSKQEQRIRFLARIDEQAKNWKVSPSDMTERAYWEDYTTAFSEMLSHTSTEYAPWHVIPADHKWYSHLSTFAVLLRPCGPSIPPIRR